MRSPTELTAAFREQGLKLTPQRQLLFRLLYENLAHPTAEAVYQQAHQQMPGISLRTVYQTLNELCAMGEVQCLDFGAGPVRFDPNIGSHQHLVCRGCGQVSDIYLDAAHVAPTCGLDGFSVEATEIVLRGLCRACNDSIRTGRSAADTNTSAQ